MKPNQPVARQQMKPLTPEEQKEQFMRAYMQKKASLAEGILYNLIQSCGRELCMGLEHDVHKDDPQKIVKMADDMATEFMKVVYHQDITIKDE